MARKFDYVFELHRFALHIKNCYRIVHRYFYKAFQKFQYIYCIFLMTQIGTKFRCAFKLHRYDLHAKISHLIQHIFFLYFKKIEYIDIYWSFLMIQIVTKFWYVYAKNWFKKGIQFCIFLKIITCFIKV